MAKKKAKRGEISLLSVDKVIDGLNFLYAAIEDGESMSGPSFTKAIDILKQWAPRMRRVTVKVTGKASNAVDKGITRTATILVPADFEDDKAASAALDRYHSTVAVKVLDDFTFKVYDGTRELKPGDYEGYSLTEFARFA